jgi:CBS domain-containing protein
MVKSYQGERTPQPRKSNIRTPTVCDHMVKQLVTFKPSQSLYEVIDVLLDKGFSGGPVVNGKNELVGIISEGDCIRELLNEKYYNQPSGTGNVGECMITKVVHINPDLNLFEAAKMFLDLRIRRFPVLDENAKLIGQISQKDVIRAIRNLDSNTWPHG